MAMVACAAGVFGDLVLWAVFVIEVDMKKFRVSFKIELPESVDSLQLDRWLQFHFAINCSMGPEDVGKFLIDRDFTSDDITVSELSAYQTI